MAARCSHYVPKCPLQGYTAALFAKVTGRQAGRRVVQHCQSVSLTRGGSIVVALRLFRNFFRASPAPLLVTRGLPPFPERCHPCLVFVEPPVTRIVDRISPRDYEFQNAW